jgi:hypothetical protein
LQEEEATDYLETLQNGTDNLKESTVQNHICQQMGFMLEEHIVQGCIETKTTHQ